MPIKQSKRLLFSKKVRIFSIALGVTSLIGTSVEAQELPPIGQKKSIANEPNPTPSQLRRLTAPYFEKNYAHYKMFETQYLRFAERNPLAHLALTATAKGQNAKADAILDTLAGRRTTKNLISLFPTISASLGASVNISGGSAIKLKGSVGPSLAMKFDTGRFALGTYAEKIDLEDNSARFLVKTNIEDVQLSAQMLGFYDIINAQSRNQGFEAPYSSENAQELAFRERLHGIVGDIPVFYTNIEQQVHEFAEAGDANRYKLGSEILAGVEKLQIDQKNRFFEHTTSPEVRLDMLGFSQETFEARIVDVLGAEISKAVAEADEGRKQEAFLAMFVTDDERHSRDLLEFDEIIGQRMNALDADLTDGQRAKLKNEITELNQKRDRFDTEYRLAKFSNSISELNSELIGLSHIVGLIDPELAANFQQKASAVVGIASAVGRMYLGDVSFSSAGQMAAGLQGLLANSGGPSTISLQIAQILENQKIIIRHLEITQKKLDYISTQISDLQTIILDEQKITREKIVKIQKQISTIQEGLFRQSALIEDSNSAKETAKLIQLIGEVEQVYENFELDGRAEIDRLNNFIDRNFHGNSPQIWEDIKEVQSAIRTAFKYTAYENPSINPAWQVDKIINDQKLKEFLKRPAIKKAGSLNYAIPRFVSNEYFKMPNPEFVGDFSLNYIEMARKLPIMPSKDIRMREICSINQEISSTTNGAITTIPIALTSLTDRLDKINATLTETMSNILEVHYEDRYKKFLSTSENQARLHKQIQTSIAKHNPRLADLAFKSKPKYNPKNQKIYPNLFNNLKRLDYTTHLISNIRSIEELLRDPVLYFNKKISSMSRADIDTMIKSEIRTFDTSNRHATLSPYIVGRNYGRHAYQDRQEIFKIASNIRKSPIDIKKYEKYYIWFDTVHMSNPPRPTPRFHEVADQVEELRSLAILLAKSVLVKEIYDLKAAPSVKSFISNSILSLGPEIERIYSDIAALSVLLEVGLGKCLYEDERNDFLESMIASGGAYFRAIHQLDDIRSKISIDGLGYRAVDTDQIISIAKKIGEVSLELKQISHSHNSNEGICEIGLGNQKIVQAEISLTHRIRPDLMPQACIFR